MTTIDLDQRLTLTREEVAQVMGFGKKKVDRLRAKGLLPSFMLDGMRLFPVAGLRERIAELTDGAIASSQENAG